MVTADTAIDIAQFLFEKTFPEQRIVRTWVRKSSIPGKWEAKILDGRDCYYLIPIDVEFIELNGDIL